MLIDAPLVDTIGGEMIATSAAVLVSIWPKLLELGIGFDMDGDHATTRGEVNSTLGAVCELCDSMKWIDIGNQARRLLRRAESGERGASMMELSRDLREAIEQKFERTQICLIEGDDFKLFKGAAKHLCGNEVIDKLSFSAEELNLAGRCISLGLSTASVGHSMRSVEASLHVLAKELGISFTTPVELQGWINLTERITGEINKKQREARSHEKAERLRKLGELLLPADGFRLAWRNHVAHGREKYEEGEARIVLRHVAEYLSRLAGAL